MSERPLHPRERARPGPWQRVGGSAALNSTTALTKSVMQIAGMASVVPADSLSALAQDSGKVRAIIIRHEELVLTQAQQAPQAP